MYPPQFPSNIYNIYGVSVKQLKLPIFDAHTPPQYGCSVTARVALSNRTENTTTTTISWAEQRNRDNYIKDQRAQSLMLKFLSFHLISSEKKEDNLALSDSY